MRSAPARIGVHTGEAAHARRLAEACDLGSALVSASAAALVERDLPPGARLQPLGDRALAGADPERLFELEHDPRAARQARKWLLFNREQESGSRRARSTAASRTCCRCMEIPSDNPASYAWRRFAVDGLLRLGRKDEARRLAEEELEIARRWGARHEIGSSLRALGLAVGGDEGERLLAEAVEMLEGTGARLQEARALLDLGAAQRRAGRRTVARERLREAADLALSGGVLSLAERANEELAALGSRPRKVLRSGLDALTPSERRVAELAAGDLSNKEIAQSLFVTVKTVELHLSSAYRKLALGSRRELAAALAVGT